MASQTNILGALPEVGQSMSFRIRAGCEVRPALARLRDGFDPSWGVLALGEPATRALGLELPGLRTFPALSGPGFSVPSTQQALWVGLGAANRTQLHDAALRLTALTGDELALVDCRDTFTYAAGRDLSGYEDGTENPRAEKAKAAAVAADGSSFVAVQRWVHELNRFERFSQTQRDATIGRDRHHNQELADAPPSAHVKRAAQESFEPDALMVRRSMPWSDGIAHGLEFVAYVESLDRFERVLRRMVGLEDGITDALFTFSRPVTGGYYWCAPVEHGQLDFSSLRL